MDDKKTINIDCKNIFNNPFQSFIPVDCSYALFEQYLSCKPNQKILKIIGNNEITSNEHEDSGITRSEILRRLACKYGYRSKPTFVHRDILANLEGIIINQVNCEGNSVGDETTERICSKYPIVKETYNKFLVKTPGAVQLIKIDQLSKLWICNLFTRVEKQPIKWIFNLFGKARAEESNDETSFRKCINKLRIQIKKNHLQNLPIYIPNEMGKYQGWNWDKNLSIILKTFPDAVICIK